MSGGFLSLRITFAYALAEEGDRRAVAEETAVPACCAFLEALKEAQEHLSISYLSPGKKAKL